MRVAWVIPCRYVEVNDNLATIVGGGIDRVWVPEVPVPQPLQLLCATRVAALHDEVHAEPPDEAPNKLISRVHSPAMELVSELEAPFALSGQFDPAIEPAVIIPIGVVFQPMEEGQHTIEIAVDDRGFSVPMTVVVGDVPPDPGG